jgi:SAM-dependent methyltransferase
MTGLEEPIRHDMVCRVCGSDSIKTVFVLNPTPPEDQFIPRDKLDLVQETYPLTLAICQSCGYLHLPDILNPEISYKNYLYETKITLGLSNHYQDYAREVLSFIHAKAGSLVIDLGSNDGTMLEAFKHLGMNVLGVEPSQKTAEIARQRGIPTVADFFCDAVVDDIIRKQGRASVITANYMYANIDDVIGFTKNVARLLAKEGVFVVQTGYHPDQMKINMFDYVYHEHFSYFSLSVLRYIFDKCGLELVDVQKFPAKGGSIRTFAQLKGHGKPVSESVQKILREEEQAGVDNPETYLRFARNIEALKKEVGAQLVRIQKSGARIAGYGGSHSTTTLTYHFEFAPFLKYIVDDNPIKHGMYSPGYHIPVYPSQHLLDDKPEYTLILAWQYQNEIISKNQEYLKNGGKFIVPLPTLRIVGL